MSKDTQKHTKRARQLDLAAYNLAAKIKLSYLRNMGDALAVSKETGVDIDKVNKFIDIIKQQEREDVSQLIANTLMQEILVSRNSILTHKIQMLQQLEKFEVSKVSWCCKQPVREEKDQNGNLYFRCTKCLDNTTVKEEVSLPVMELKEKVLSSILLVNESLINAAKAMGYTTKDEIPQNVINNKNYFVMVDAAKSVVGQSEYIPENIKDMRPIEIEETIKHLEQKMRKDRPPVVDVGEDKKENEKKGGSV